MRYFINKLANKIESTVRSNNFPFVILLLIMIVLHQAISTYSFSDEQSVRDTTTWSNAWERYTQQLTINNRVIPMALYYTLPLLPEIVWKFLDISVVMLIALSLSILFHAETRSSRTLNWVIVGLILLYPMKDMSSAGWLTTTIFYSWIVAFTFVSFIPIQKWYKKEPVGMKEYVVYTIATIIASNSPQPAVIISVLYALFWADIFHRSEEVPKFLTFQFCVAFTSLIFFTFHPATIHRLEAEKQWWIDFDMISTIQKLKMGIGDTFSHFLAFPDPIFILLCGIILYAVIRKYKDPFYRVISAIPFGLSVLPLLAPIVYRIFPAWERWVQYQYKLANLYDGRIVEITTQDRLTLLDYTILENYLPIIIHIILAGLICIALYLIFENTRKTILVVAIFMLGMFSRLTMGFSPTLLGSSARTFLFLYAAMAVCILFIFSELNGKREGAQP